MINSEKNDENTFSGFWAYQDNVVYISVKFIGLIFVY